MTQRHPRPGGIPPARPWPRQGPHSDSPGPGRFGAAPGFRHPFGFGAPVRGAIAFRKPRTIGFCGEPAPSGQPAFPAIKGCRDPAESARLTPEACVHRHLRPHFVRVTYFNRRGAPGQETGDRMGDSFGFRAPSGCFQLRAPSFELPPPSFQLRQIENRNSQFSDSSARSHTKKLATLAEFWHPLMACWRPHYGLSSLSMLSLRA